MRSFPTGDKALILVEEMHEDLVEVAVRDVEILCLEEATIRVDRLDPRGGVLAPMTDIEHEWRKHSLSRRHHS